MAVECLSFGTACMGVYTYVVRVYNMWLAIYLLHDTFHWLANLKVSAVQLLCILASPGICTCRTISLILPDFACFCKTILHDSAPREEFRLSEVNSELNILQVKKNSDIIPTPLWLPLTYPLFGQWFGTCNPLASIRGWHSSWIASILSDLYLAYVLASWIISGKIWTLPGQQDARSVSGTVPENPGLSRKIRDGWQVAMAMTHHFSKSCEIRFCALKKAWGISYCAYRIRSIRHRSWIVAAPPNVLNEIRVARVYAWTNVVIKTKQRV